ncbi:hypothetical protein NQ317_015765 [Molorchus minor]|uniref:C2HC/C3H-type domain-containing protein n=1 Tax=Molorchus minor TaxID=1323400 RepID=A0ABQ9K3E2_9CUCU|nr:hypothetical protein NQ317_015765 [Molorchus minor]
MLKSLFPWKHHKTKAMAAQQTMEVVVPEDPSFDQPLLPCHVCGRTFLPAPLRKHERICEKSTVKKRKPFDSLRQRVEGTDLADFHQKSYLKKIEPKSTPEPKRNKRASNWKEKHLELVNTIRAAKGIPSNTDAPSPKGKSTSSLMAGNERCPSCDRQFGPKAYDRHVEWCKEKKAQQRIHHSPADVLLAKERLEARIKYKVAVRDKYCNNNTSTSTETLASSKNMSPLSRGPSVRKPRSEVNVLRGIDKLSNGTEKARLDGTGVERVESSGDKHTPLIGQASKADIGKNGNIIYDPFESAQRQFMELLECDDFKSLTPSNNISRPHTTTGVSQAKKASPAAKKKTIKSAEPLLTRVEKNNHRASVIEPPNTFKDSLDSVNDDFELIENLINDQFTDDNKNSNSFYLHSKPQKESLTLGDILDNRKYSDDMSSSSIDPRLINENDDLSIPEHFKIDDFSPTSTTDTDMTLQNDVDHYSLQYDKKIAALEPKVEKISPPPAERKPLVKRSVSLLNRSKTDQDSVKVTSKKLTNKSKLTSRSVSSVSATKNVSVDKKKGLAGLKKTTALFEPLQKPPSLKNKNDVDNYFSEKQQRNSRSSPEKEVCESVEDALKPEDLFAVDDEMYEEYKKYEEMYLKEKAQQSGKKRNKPKMIDINFGILTASEEEDQGTAFNNKISNDSAYGSLTRKTAKHRSKTPKLTPLEQKPADSTSSSGSDNCPASPSLAKFCHECGNKYPLTTAKFCIECEVLQICFLSVLTNVVLVGNKLFMATLYVVIVFEI